MPVNTKASREKLGSLHNKMEALLERVGKEGRKFNAEEQTEWERMNTEFDETREFVVNAEKLEQRGKDLRKTSDDDDLNPQDRDRKKRSCKGNHREAPTAEHRALALQAWCRVQMGFPLKREHKEAVLRCRMQPERRRLDLPVSTNIAQVRAEYERQTKVEKRAMSSVNLAAGGALVPEGFMNNLEVAKLYYGAMLQVADIWRTESGNPIPHPTSNDTSNEGEILGENKEVSAQDLTFGAITFGAHKFSSKIIIVPVELLEDSAFNLVSYLGTVAGERIGRRKNRAFTLGTGNSGPRGIVPAATTFDAAANNALAFDDINKLFHAVDPSYRGNGTFMFHDQIVLTLRTLKDSQNRPLWIVDPLGTQPDTILGRPYVINQHMDSTFASGKKTVLFGDLSKYKVREVASVRMRRLVERYAEKDQEGFVVFERADGNLLDAGSHPVKVLKH